MRWLICEGPCNPHRPAIDLDVKAERARVFITGTYPPLRPDLVDRLHSLRHTPHSSIDVLGYRESWTCERCGNTRIYGYRFRAEAAVAEASRP